MITLGMVLVMEFTTIARRTNIESATFFVILPPFRGGPSKLKRFFAKSSIRSMLFYQSVIPLLNHFIAPKRTVSSIKVLRRARFLDAAEFRAVSSSLNFDSGVPPRHSVAVLLFLRRQVVLSLSSFLP